MSWRSANSFTSTARNSASSGGASVTTGSALSREARSRMATVQPAGARARREQHEGVLLAREIEQMEQRALVEPCLGDILDHQRAGRECRRQALGRQARAPRGSARRHRLPRSPRDGSCPNLPARPAPRRGAGQSGQALDQRQRRGVRRPAQKILARETFAVIERERELTRSGGRHRHGAQAGRPPV